MKKVIIILLAVIGFAANSAQAQDNLIKVNIFSPVVRTASVFYEKPIAEDKSVQLGFFYTGFSIEDVKLRGYGITPEFRKYLSASKQAPEGFYVAPFLRYQSLNMTLDEDSEMEDMNGKATLNAFGGGLLIGHQWIVGSRFVVDSFLGPSYSASNVKVTAGDQEEFDDSIGTFSGFGLRAGLTIGLRF
ncbi:DUF3575 domain-containing protein [Pontibacter sp. SGAir0037]|uniref:DUF3575 domain-containing protein n=1 Tax=Pontibacter sp. SGAir0037 TaxID=2571030 RepID=UPI0010CCE7BC|nr:DUF3575 domain-containing protein [Pontibacter sp. SGAir0037]QCR24032.1 hypothetical protein C1N53_17840 [Pontibacter sp. SGAir0037]